MSRNTSPASASGTLIQNQTGLLSDGPMSEPSAFQRRYARQSGSSRATSPEVSLGQGEPNRGARVAPSLRRHRVDT